ncbi:uncharacterized protein LOC111636936 [Centruroides sculpturatus]|uniref:uncharacterized protein LOC111636936 n=1 Tax=Centruroides sculpturatus TaxID=218467 RepID=UPI000C6CB264|nr:uncharacterized protein LOC111636936 [Centruroides sculpturatus]
MRKGNNIDLDNRVYNNIEMSLSEIPSVAPNKWPLIYNQPWLEQNLNIFTDGSKNDEEVGCAFVAFQRNTEIYTFSDRLGSTCSAFQAELWAILSAIKWCNHNFNSTDINIFTDSCSSVQAISNYNWRHPIVNCILNNLLENNNRFTVIWVRGHCGVFGNERADELARSAATSCDDPTYSATPQSYIIQRIKDYAKDRWQRCWNTHNNTLTKDFFPLVSNTVKNDVEHCLTQFYTGHGRFYQYLHRFKISNQQNCTICGVPDGSRHYLLECPMLDDMRARITALLPNNCGWPPDLSILIGDNNLFQATRDLIKTYFKRTTVI